ncbi:unnamed protein product [Cercospora beticola]|nr:unnamed protein product [Cercospora beticola]
MDYEKGEAITPMPSNTKVAGEVYAADGQEDAVFGEIVDTGPNYRNVGWLGTTALMLKTQIGLGVLSIPSVFDTVGMIPGVILLITIASLNAWSNYMVGVFKNNHREVYGIDDAGRIMLGNWCREILATAFVLYEIFVAGAAMLGVSIALNALSAHGACTAIFVAVAAIIGFCLASIRTLGKISWLAWIGVTCIIVSLLTLTVSVGIQDRPAAAPQDAVWVSDYKLVAQPSFRQAMSAISTLVFAYAGTPTFFPIAAEMRDPKMYKRSLMACQVTVTLVYLVIGIVVYYFCGSYVASPALGSAGVLLKKICYGIALPGLIVTTALITHMPAKYAFVRILRGSRHLTHNTIVHWSTWLGCVLAATIIAYVIASGIPVFGSLVSLVGALLGTFLSFQPMAGMWLYDNWSDGKGKKSIRWMGMVAFCGFMLVIGTFIMVAGSYSAIAQIIDDYNATGGSAAWSCADNSGSA